MIKMLIGKVILLIFIALMIVVAVFMPSKNESIMSNDKTVNEGIVNAREFKQEKSSNNYNNVKEIIESDSEESQECIEIDSVSLEGEVVSCENDRISFANLTYSYLGNGNTIEKMTTDINGHFQIEDLVKGSKIRIKAEKGNNGSTEIVTEVESNINIQLKLSKINKFYGYVKYDNNNICKEYSLELWRLNNEAEEYEDILEYLSRSTVPREYRVEGPFKVNDINGYFEINNIRPGYYQVIVKLKNSPGYVWKKVKLVENENKGPEIISLDNNKSLLISIKDSINYEPISGAKIYLGYDRGINGFINVYEAESDFNGERYINGLNSKMDIRVEAKGYSVYTDMLFQPIFSDKTYNDGDTVKIIMTKGIELNVIVKADQGLFEKSAKISVHFPSGRQEVRKTNAEGMATFKDIPSNTWLLVICYDSKGEFYAKNIVCNDKINNIVFGKEFNDQMTQIVGRVCSNGNSVKNGFVEISKKNTRRSNIYSSLKKDGSFRFGMLEKGDYNITVNVGKYFNDNDHEYILENVMKCEEKLFVGFNLPSNSLKGKIINKLNENIRDAKICAVRNPITGILSNNLKYNIRAKSKSDEKGVFKIDYIPDGDYFVKIMKEGYETVKIESFICGCVDLGSIQMKRK